MNKNTCVEINNLWYTIQGNQILKNVNLEILNKETVSILWYNGSWKSTLLKLVLGVISPSVGKIKFRDGIKMWYVPQKLNFDRKLPIVVKDFLNIYLGKDWKNIDEEIAWILKITELLNKPLFGLSGGQLQKILIYCALVGNPNLLLLDEPTSGLDVNAQKDFYNMLEFIREKIGCAIVIVSHDIHMVYNKSDKVICLHNGICCVGKPQEEDLDKNLKNIFWDYISPYIHHHNHHDR